MGKKREEQKYAIKFVFIDVVYVTQHYCMAWQNPGFRLVDVRSVKKLYSNRSPYISVFGPGNNNSPKNIHILYI